MWEDLQMAGNTEDLHAQFASTPGAIQHSYHLSTSDSQECIHVQDLEHWLPSMVAEPQICLDICIAGLPKIEEHLQTTQCYGALDSMCHAHCLKMHMCDC